MTLAILTGPQIAEPSPNWAHSASEPEPLVTVVRETSVSACLKILSPKLPVSRRMSSIVWQVEMPPGLQIVTLTHGLFR